MPQKIFKYKPYLKTLARELRNKSTLSEVILWKHLKGKQMMGYDFHRQKPIDRYIVDFFCSELALAIEIDGDSHDDRYEIDSYRQNRLKNQGIRFLRFDDMEIKNNIGGVLEFIKNWIIVHKGVSNPNR